MAKTKRRNYLGSLNGNKKRFFDYEIHRKQGMYTHRHREKRQDNKGEAREINFIELYNAVPDSWNLVHLTLEPSSKLETSPLSCVTSGK